MMLSSVMTIIPSPAIVQAYKGADGKLYGRTADGRWFVYSEIPKPLESSPPSGDDGVCSAALAAIVI
jgi:hypothetical protein